MKLNSYYTLPVLVGGLLFLAGCGKSEQASAPTPPEPPKAVEPAAPVIAAADAAAPAVPQAAAQAQTQVVAAPAAVEKPAADAQVQASSLTSKTQTTIDQVKKLLADKNWSEALKALNDLAAAKLTPEQQATIESLKQQALKMGQEAAAAKLTEQGSKAVGDLLKK